MIIHFAMTTGQYKKSFNLVFLFSLVLSYLSAISNKQTNKQKIESNVTMKFKIDRSNHTEHESGHIESAAMRSDICNKAAGDSVKDVH